MLTLMFTVCNYLCLLKATLITHVLLFLTGAVMEFSVHLINFFYLGTINNSLQFQSVASHCFFFFELKFWKAFFKNQTANYYILSSCARETGWLFELMYSLRSVFYYLFHLITEAFVMVIDFKSEAYMSLLCLYLHIVRYVGTCPFPRCYPCVKKFEVWWSVK